VRVVAGSLRSRALRAPKGSSTRPTSDRVRESLFSVLGDVAGAKVLDLYAGSGALAIEALSRGAPFAVCVESARAALEAIEDNRKSLGLETRLRVVARRVAESAKSLTDGPFDLIFADPPYADVPSGVVPRDLAALFGQPFGQPGVAAKGALLVLEHAARDAAPTLVAGARALELEETRRWGDTAASFYRFPEDA
jgi:16S rRNA (guanine(966)-N(2))-methyltransferase RsmD